MKRQGRNKTQRKARREREQQPPSPSQGPLKVTRRKKKINFKGAIISLTLEFSTETLGVIRQQTDIFGVEGK